MSDVTQEERDDVMSGLRIAGQVLEVAWVLDPDNYELELEATDGDELYALQDGRVMLFHDNTITFYPEHRVLKVRMALDDIVRSAKQKRDILRNMQSSIVTPAVGGKEVM